jgi:hypothetical protein
MTRLRTRWGGPAKVRTDHVATTDQHLLAEIRDHLVALPLANELKHQDVETAKKLRAEMDDLYDRIAHQGAIIRLLQRVTGVDAEQLSEDELALLVETGAMSA